MRLPQEDRLPTLLNSWIKINTQSEINFNFNEESLYDEDSIKQMKTIYYYIKKNGTSNDFDLNLSNQISKHIVNYLNFINGVSNEISNESNNENNRLKYKITPKMLEYKGYNKTKFKNLRGLYGLMQMN